MHILKIPPFFTPYEGEFCLEQSKALAGYSHDIRIIAHIQLSEKFNIRD